MSLRAVPLRFAVKRLAAVELPEHGSNQHEFNATLLRKKLDLPAKTEGRLSILHYVEDDQPPRRTTVEFTLYDSREKANAKRRALKLKERASEYRLYYYSSENAKQGELGAFVGTCPGDLLIVFRPTESHDLVAIVIRAGMQLEIETLETLSVDPKNVLAAVTGTGTTRAKKKKASAVVPRVRPKNFVFAEPSQHPLVTAAVASKAIPPPRLIAEAASALVAKDLTADAFLVEALGQESKLYFAIEAAVKGSELESILRDATAGLDSVLSFSMSLFQSRKSRRGLSLQFHFEALLARENIPFTPQCETEHGEKPDIVVPGKKEYHDLSFPEDLLRMIACKTTIRERWSQVEREAQRIQLKYLLTLDDQITPDTVENMVRRHIIPFVPESIRARRYEAQEVRNVEELLEDLRHVAAETRARLAR